jgi:DNA polymerase-3 subunit epsilon
MSYLAQFIKELRGRNYYILDTETTGLDGEVIQIAIIDQAKKVCLDTLVKPVYRVPEEATAIHGISNEDVKDAPIWADVSPLVFELLNEENVIVYNAVFDRKMMHHSAEYLNLPRIDWKEIANFYCAMEAYAEFFGEWKPYHASYKWQKLQAAAASVGYHPEMAHTALSDCLSTWAVVEMLLMQDADKAADRFSGNTDAEDY